MAEKKKNGSDADAPALPKKIEGVKLPKDIRTKLTDLAKHPAVAALVAAGLATLAARNPKVQKTAAKAAGKVKDAVQGVAAEVASVVTSDSSKPVTKRPRKTTATRSAAAEPAPAKPPARRPRKSSATAAASSTAAPATRSRKTAEKSGTPATPKPRATRRKAPAKPKPTKADN